MVCLVFAVAWLSCLPSANLFIKEYPQWSYALSAFLSLIVLMVCVATVLVSYRPFKKLEVKIGAFVIIFVYGVIVYTFHYQHIDKDPISDPVALPSLFTYINNVLSVFFPSRGAYESIANENYFLRLNFHLLHLLTYIYGALVIVAWLGARMMNRLQLYLSPKKQWYVFFDVNEPSKLLTKNIAEKEPETGCIFLLSKEQEDDTELFRLLDELDVVVLYRDFEQEKLDILNDKVLAKTTRYFFLSEDQDFNVRMALKVSTSINTNTNVTHLYIRTEQERIDNFFTKKDNLELHFFNQSDLTARKFVEQYPMLDCPKINIDKETLWVEGEFRLLLLGFGWRGQELLKKCICDAQFKGSKFSATVIDRDFESKYGDYPLLYNECIKEYNLEFNPEKITEIGSLEFYKWLDENAKQYNRIIIALGDDCTNVEIALKIAGTFQYNSIGVSNIAELRKLIFAHVRQKNRFNYYGTEKSPITIFGELSEIYTFDVVVNESMDKIGKMVNYVYAKYDKPEFNTLDDKWAEIETEWKGASIFNKNSSRAVAMNIENIYKIIGKNWNVLSDKDKLEILAENEHLRWNAFHFVNGIRKWDSNQITTGNAKLRDNMGNLLKHGCLVPFSELQAISDKVNSIRDNTEPKEDYQETDRRIVRHFQLFWQELKKQKFSR